MPKSSDEPCFDLSAVFTVFAARWKAEILWQLRDEPKRFNELRRLVGPVSPKMLASQLRAMERDGLVRRKLFAEVPARVEYSSTALAKSLHPLLEQAFVWWDQRWRAVSRARRAYDKKAT